MSKYLFVIVIGVILSSYNTPQKKGVCYERIIPDSVLCETINCFINDTSIEEFKQSNRFVDNVGRKVLRAEDSLRIIKLDALFTKDDIDFIFNQNRTSIYFNISECLKNELLISGDTLRKINRSDNFWEEFHKRYGKDGFCIINLPLFSRNHNIVILRYSRSNGRLNASGGIFIYRKIANKWTNIMCIDSWIS